MNFTGEMEPCIGAPGYLQARLPGEKKMQTHSQVVVRELQQTRQRLIGL